MAPDETLEHQLQSVFHYDHRQCVEELQRIDQPRLDFSVEYLERLSVDRLRHLLAAAYLQARKHRPH